LARKKLLFIFNPWSGKAQVKQKLFDIIDRFVKAGYQVTVHPTQEKLDARNVAKKSAKKFDVIVASGGDGTMNEVVDGLMECEKRPLLGYIPTGTVNDFASSLKISKNIMKAVDGILQGKTFACDIGSFNEEYFTYVAAFGAFTDVAYQTPQQSKNMLGKMAYVLEGMKRLGNLQAYPMRVEYDGNVIEENFLFGMVTNSTSVGGFKGISGKGVKMDDGLFEVSLIKMPKNPLEMQMIINSLLTREPNEYVHSFRSGEIHFYSETPVPWTLDGEYGGSIQQAVIHNHKQAISILTTKEQSKSEVKKEEKQPNPAAENSSAAGV
jgi:diacylglycerol kinase (ATP)